MNIVIGFAINYWANMLILPLVGFHITHAQNWFIGAMYTIVSLVCSYAIRRWFNARLHSAAEKLAGIGTQQAPVWSADIGCAAFQISDQMVCPCGATWDINDPFPPECGALK